MAHRVVPLCVTLATLFGAFLASSAVAANRLLLEVGDRGMASATIVLEPVIAPTAGTQPSPPSVLVVALPFDLDPTYRISKPDDMEIAVLSNGDGYCLLAVIAPAIVNKTSITIDNAFNLVDERAKRRVKLSCDLSYKYLKRNRGILKDPSGISSFDVTLTLPRKYTIDELSFEPARSTWAEDDPGRTYTLNAASLNPQSPGEIWIAFPSPFQSGLHFAQLITSLIIGLFALGVEGRFAVERKLRPWLLIVIFLVSVTALGVAAYFGLTLANQLEFLAWAAGPLIPIAVAPFLCIWLVLASRFEAEVSGNVKIDGEPARYVTVALMVRDSDGERIRKQMNVKEDGTYRFFVWCGKKQAIGYVVASAAGTSGGRSEQEFPLIARSKIPVPVINVNRVKLKRTVESEAEPVAPHQ